MRYDYDTFFSGKNDRETHLVVLWYGTYSVSTGGGTPPAGSK